MEKINAKEIVLPHSQAKLDLYKNYLSNYLRVLGLAAFINKINLFDIYCGIGLYKDGNIGSPLITNQCVKQINEQIMLMSKPLKSISIFINDFEKKKIESVQKMLSLDSLPNCSYDFFNKDANEMLEIVATKVNISNLKERNLIFIDPYGYSAIDSGKIFSLIKNERTEIILFLPIMQMYRFTDIALNDPNRSCYANLRKFIFSFFPPSHKIHKDKMETVFEFINEIKQALSYNDKFYTCSHTIQRDKGNYYALFFITSNIYGLDKMVEAKWKLDPIMGKGFMQKRNVAQQSMFDEHFEEQDNKLRIDFLKDQILLYLKTEHITGNVGIYSMTLKNEFRPSHANIVLKELITNKKIYTCDIDGQPISTAGAYYLDYTHFKDNNNKVYFKIN